MKAKVLFLVLVVFISSSLFGVYHKVGNVSFYGEPFGIAVLDSIAYVAGDGVPLRVINISDPYNPELINSVSLGPTAYSIRIYDTLAYVACSEEGMQIIDISDPVNPIILGAYDTELPAHDVVVSNSTAFIAEGVDTRLQIVDVCDPSHPTHLVTLQYEGITSYQDMAVENNLLYLSCCGSLLIIDISDPSNPELISDTEFPELIFAITICDNEAYIGYSAYYEEGFCRVDISDPSEPIILNEHFYGDGRAFSMKFIEDKLFILSHTRGLMHYDVSNPDEPILIGEFNGARRINRFAIIDGFAFLTSQDERMHIVDISNPDNSHLIGRCEIDNRSYSIGVQGDYAFVGGRHGLHVVSGINTGDPVYSGCMEVAEVELKDIVVCGNYLFTEGRLGRLLTVDIANPANPQIIAEYDSLIHANDMVLCDERIFIVNNNGLFVIDSSNPQNLSELGSISVAGYPISLCVDENIVYVTYVNDTEWRLFVFDASDPSDIGLIGQCDLDYACGIEVYGAYAYIAAKENGFHIVDISEPETPTYICAINPNEDSFFIDKPLIIGNKLLVNDRGWNEIFTYNISNPTNPILESSYRWNLDIEDMEIYEDYLVTANGYNGISILDLGVLAINETASISQKRPTSLTNYPNPFNPTTTIEFSLNERSMVNLSIHNIKGQLVKALVNNEQYDIGSHSIVWSGKDSSGNYAASGVYFYKLESGEEVITKKMILMK